MVTGGARRWTSRAPHAALTFGWQAQADSHRYVTGWLKQPNGRAGRPQWRPTCVMMSIAVLLRARSRAAMTALASCMEATAR